MNEYFFHDHLSPALMDMLWANGWRHFGSYFFRYSEMEKDGQCFHVQPLRLRLEHFTVNRSQRRTLGKNRDLAFSVKAAYIDSEVTELFERHKTRFKDNVPESLETFLSDEPAVKPCPCLSLCLHLEGALVGVSYLDMGEVACSSVYQCFEPSLAKRGLGIFMMLLAAHYAREQGKTFYYPGYAFKEPSFYDYKKTLRGLEAFDWKTWQPLR
ncbi:MAG: arginine-tRNA-protein transferase [Trueperaceae bacterium]